MRAVGADLGLHAIRLALRAYDQRAIGTSLTREVMMRFHNDPFEAVAWMDRATATDYATFAPLVMRHADSGDSVARRIVRDAAEQIYRAGAPASPNAALPRRPCSGARLSDAAVAGARCPSAGWFPLRGIQLDGALHLVRRAVMNGG